MRVCKHCSQSFKSRRLYEGHLSGPRQRCPMATAPVVAKPRAVQVPNEDETINASTLSAKTETAALLVFSALSLFANHIFY